MNKFNWQHGLDKISQSILHIITLNNIIIKNGMTEIVIFMTTFILLIIHKIKLKMQMVEYGLQILLKSV